jgi:hypothetical protein
MTHNNLNMKKERGKRRGKREENESVTFLI